MYMRKGQKKEYYINKAIAQDMENEKLREENRKISAALCGILDKKEKLKQQALEDAQAEIDKRIKEVQDECTDRVEHVERDREKLLNALGIDEIEWSRIYWRY